MCLDNTCSDECCILIFRMLVVQSEERVASNVSGCAGTVEHHISTFIESYAE
jgi:hypothetical protein